MGSNPIGRIRLTTPTGRENRLRPGTVRVRIPGELLIGAWWNGIHNCFKRSRPLGHESSNLSAPTYLLAYGLRAGSAKAGWKVRFLPRGLQGDVAELVQHPVVNRKIAGSSPVVTASALPVELDPRLRILEAEFDSLLGLVTVV